MKFKLSHNQLITLSNIFQAFAGEDTPKVENFEARLLLAIMLGIDRQIRRKLIDKKKKYNLNLNDVECFAFWIFFSKYEIIPVEAIYEATLINLINNQIHQSLTK
jgi:hypothetical protein